MWYLHRQGFRQGVRIKSIGLERSGTLTRNFLTIDDVLTKCTWKYRSGGQDNCFPIHVHGVKLKWFNARGRYVLRTKPDMRQRMQEKLV